MPIRRNPAPSIEGRFQQIEDHLVFARLQMVDLMPLLPERKHEAFQHYIDMAEEMAHYLIRHSMLFDAERASIKAGAFFMKQWIEENKLEKLAISASSFVRDCDGFILLIETKGAV